MDWNLELFLRIWIVFGTGFLIAVLLVILFEYIASFFRK